MGVPYEEIGGKTETGAVNVLYGSGGGLSSAGNQMWHQDQPGVAGGTIPPSLPSGVPDARIRP